MDGMEVQENEGGRRRRGRTRERPKRTERKGRRHAPVASTHPCAHVREGKDDDGGGEARAHTSTMRTMLVTWSLAISRWLLRACECGGWCWRYR